MSRTYTYYDENNVAYPQQQVRDMGRAQWDSVVPNVEPVKCRGHKGLPYIPMSNAEGVVKPAVRVVAYKTNQPSKHVCGARCRNSTGANCECSCGGEHHGVDA